MPYSFYKVLHLTGLFMVFMSLGGITLHMVSGGTKEFAGRKLAGITHGVGLLISLVAGFGLVARIGTGFQPWVIAKLVIWFLFGGLSAAIYRHGEKSGFFWALIMILGGTAAYLAQYKPF